MTTFYDLFYMVAVFVVLVTAIARINDIKKCHNTPRWWVHRIGLAMIAASSAMLLSAHFTVGSPYWFQVTRLMFMWGLALTWLSKPETPWRRWIARQERIDAKKKD